MARPIKLGVLISGRGSNLEAVLNAIEAKTLDASVEVVLSNKPDAAGLTHATNRQIPAFGINPKTFESPTLYEEHLVTLLKNHQVDLVVLAGYMKLIQQPLLTAFHNKIINIHPSLLPSFKGLHAQKQAFDYGVKITGCTTHIVTEGMDEGPILMQTAVSVLDTDTLESLSQRILEQEHLLLPKTIQHLKEKFI